MKIGIRHARRRPLKKRQVGRSKSVAEKLAAMSDQQIARLIRGSHRLPRRPRFNRRTKGPSWTAREDQLLGKWPDKRLAWFLGRTYKSVQSRRLKRGIRFAPPGRPWTPDEERLLDPSLARGPIQKWVAQVARQLGRSVIAVSAHRRLKYGRVRPSPRRWTRREFRLLGTRPDREVATLIGRKCGTVRVTRNSLGVPSYRARQKFRWTPARDRLLGTLTDRELGERFGCSRKEVEARRHALGIPAGGRRPWTLAEERVVGTMRDAEVARRIGRTIRAVGHRRRALEIAGKRRKSTHQPA